MLRAAAGRAARSSRRGATAVRLTHDVGTAAGSTVAETTGFDDSSRCFCPSSLAPVPPPPLLDCNTDLLRIGVVVAVVLALYASSADGELTFDDHLALSDNEDTHANSDTTLWGLFQHDYWGTRLTAITSNGSFRPVTVLTFRLQHWFSGFDHCASSLRAVNVFISLLNGVWIYALTRLYLPDSRCSGGIHQLSPALAMLLFMCHPVHTDAVVSIVGRAELLSCFFGFCALFCMHAFLVHHPSFMHSSGPCNKKNDDGKMHETGRHNVLVRTSLLLLMSIFLLLCVLSKDGGITFAALCMLHAAFVHRQRWTSARRAILPSGITMLLSVGYVLLRHIHLGAVDLVSSRLIRRTENPQYFTPSGFMGWWGFRWVIQVKNLELLFFPTQLCCEYSYNCVPSINSLYDARLPFMTVVTAAAIGVSGKYAWRFFRHGDAISLTWWTACGWLVIPYTPVSHLFVGVGTFIAERCLYVPSVGAVLLIVYTLMGGVKPQPRKRQGPRSLAGFAALLLLALFWARVTYVRIGDWHDDVALFRSAVRVCPGSGKARFLLGSAILRRENNVFTPEVVQLLREAYALDSEYKEPLYFLGIYAYNNEKNVSKALALLRECTSSPFTLEQCYPVFNEVRSKAFPDMTKWQALEDNAALASTMEEKAAQYHLAGMVLQQEEKDACAASKDFRTAMSMWNVSGLYWFEDRIQWNTEISFCQTLQWYAQSSSECIALLSLDERAAASASMALFLEQAVTHCDDPWDRVAPSESQSYMHRPVTFSMISTLMHVLLKNEILPAVSKDPEALLIVRHAVATIAARHYCYLSSFVNTEVGKRMGAVNDDVMHVHKYFQMERATLLERVSGSVGELRPGAGITDDIRTLLQCAAELSAIVMVS